MSALTAKPAGRQILNVKSAVHGALRQITLGINDANFMKNDFSLWHFIKRNLLKIYFALSLLVVGFAYGLISSEYKMPPYATLMDARAAIKDWKKNWKAYTIVPQHMFLFRSIHP